MRRWNTISSKRFLFEMRTKGPFCKCGCGQRVSFCRWNRRWNKYLPNHQLPLLRLQNHRRAIRNRGEAPKCACGCGKDVVWNRSRTRWNKFLNGHNMVGKVGKDHPTWGHPTSALQKERASKASRERVYTPELCKRISDAKKNKHFHFSEETKRKMSRARMGRFTGPNSPVWRGGFRKYGSGFTLRLKLQIKKRDNFICQICGGSEGENKHAVHHIDYSKNNHKPENLLTLCISCHAKTNFNRRYWISLFLRLCRRNELAV